MNNPITVPLPQDLPTDWTMGQTVAPNGTDVGLSAQYGYNYLMKQVNAAQQAAEQCGEGFSDAAGKFVPSAAGNLATLSASGDLQDSGKQPSDFASAPLSSDLTLYVSTTGNDSNDGLSAGTAKRTIQAAVDSIPKNLGGHSVTIEIADGDYTDAGPVSLYGFFGGSSQRGDAPELLFRGASRDGTIVGSISAVLPGIRGCITNLSVSVTDRSSGIYWVGHCRVWRANVNVTYDGYGYGIGAGDGFMILEDVCSNGPNAAVSTAGILYVNNLSGASVTAIIVGGSSPFAQPAFAIVNNNTVEATSTKYAKYSGAVIFENGVLVE